MLTVSEKMKRASSGIATGPSSPWCSSPAASEITPVIDDIHTILAAAGHAQVPILYGGSVTAAIAGDILAHGAVSGLLVGTASLEPAAFASIIAAAGDHARLDRPNTGR